MINIYIYILNFLFCLAICRENSNKHAGEGQKSLRRATSIIGMAPDIDKSTWSQAEIEKYGLGTGNVWHRIFVTSMASKIFFLIYIYIYFKFIYIFLIFYYDQILHYHYFFFVFLCLSYISL